MSEEEETGEERITLDLEPAEKRHTLEGWAREEYENFRNLDLIEKFVRIVTPYCDSPLDYIEAGAYFLVSSLLGRFTVLVDVGSGKPNPWFILSSIPGLFRRSSILRHVKYVYRRALTRFYDSKLPRDSDEAERDRRERIERIIGLSMIEEGTVEGIADHIEIALSEGINSFAIMSDEFGGILKRISSLQHETGVAQLLSRLKYGEEWSQSLSTRGGKKGHRYIPPGLFVTMFTSMQEPEQYITPGQVRQGLMRRLMILYKRPADKERWLPPLMPERREVWWLLDCYAKELADKMLTLSERTYFQIRYDDEEAVPITHFVVLDEINEYAKEIEMGLVEKDRKAGRITNLDIYRLGAIEQIIELSAIRCLAKFQYWGGDEEWRFVVTDDDLERAIDFHQRIWRRANEAFEKIGTRRRPVEIETTPDLVYEIIRESGKEGISRTQFYRRVYNLDQGQLDKALKSLRRSGRIIEIVRKTGRPGRPECRIYATEFFTEEELEEMLRESICARR